MNRRDFLIRAVLVAVIATPLARALLGRWVTLHRAGDPVPETIMRVEPPLPGRFGVDAVSVRTFGRTHVWPVRQIPEGRAICEWREWPDPGVPTAFTGAPTTWHLEALSGARPEGYGISVTTPTFAPPS
jgi:hypothetical protein